MVRGMNARKNVEATFVIFPVNCPAAKTIEQISIVIDAMNRLDKAFHLAYYHNRFFLVYFVFHQLSLHALALTLSYLYV